MRVACPNTRQNSRCFRTLEMKMVVYSYANRAIFVWPWNEQARTKQKEQTNANRAIWLVCRTETNARGFLLVTRTLGWKNFTPEELSRNQSILHFDVILQHHWPIEQCPLHIRVFFGGKAKSPCFDLFIHWLIIQITNTYRNHFSRSYKNRCKTHFPKVLHLASFWKKAFFVLGKWPI